MVTVPGAACRVVGHMVIPWVDIPLVVDAIRPVPEMAQVARVELKKELVQVLPLASEASHSGLRC